MYLRQSTASQSRIMGPFVDDVDFKTAETGLTIADTDVKIMVNGGASANKNSGGGTHRINGHYSFTFDATDTATVGAFEVSIVVAGALPVWKLFFVLEEAVYDALFAASAPGPATPTNITAGTITTVTNLTNAPTAGDLTATMKTSVQTAGAAALAAFFTSSAQLVTDIWAAGTRTLTSFGALVSDTASAVWSAGTRLLTAGTNIVLAKGTGVTGFNDLSAAQVNAEADTALSDYDGPTNAELAAALGTADDAVLAAIVTLRGADSDTLKTLSDQIDGVSGGSLTAQGVRDAMKLAPTAGAPAAGSVDLQLDEIQAKSDTIPASPAAVGSAMTLTSGERTAIANATLDQTDGVYPGVTPRQAQRLLVASQGAKTDGMGTSTAHIRNPADTKNVVTATVDAVGNRSAITLDLT